MFCWEWHVLSLSTLSLMHERLCSIWWLSQVCFSLFCSPKVEISVWSSPLSAWKYTVYWQKLPSYHNSRDPSQWLCPTPVTPLSVFRRLAKSTLLLIPLFGVNYVVFVYYIDEIGEMENYKIFFDLGLGSFQVRNMPKCVTSDYTYLNFPLFHSLEILFWLHSIL